MEGQKVIDGRRINMTWQERRQQMKRIAARRSHMRRIAAGLLIALAWLALSWWNDLTLAALLGS